MFIVLYHSVIDGHSYNFVTNDINAIFYFLDFYHIFFVDHIIGPSNIILDQEDFLRIYEEEFNDFHGYLFNVAGANP